jgi:hypothetical protein
MKIRTNEEIAFRETKYLIFSLIGYSPSGKTKMFCIKNKKQDVLGMIYWRATWRKYVWTPFESYDLDVNCTKDIVEFLESLTTEHKQILKERKEGKENANTSNKK